MKAITVLLLISVSFPSLAALTGGDELAWIPGGTGMDVSCGVFAAMQDEVPLPDSAEIVSLDEAIAGSDRIAYNSGHEAYCREQEANILDMEGVSLSYIDPYTKLYIFPGGFMYVGDASAIQNLSEKGFAYLHSTYTTESGVNCSRDSELSPMVCSTL